MNQTLSTLVSILAVVKTYSSTHFFFLLYFSPECTATNSVCAQSEFHKRLPAVVGSSRGKSSRNIARLRSQVSTH
jgi:hypothetical protein